MRKFFYYILVCALFLISCEKSENSIPECKVENPMEELSWLKDVKNSITNCTCQISILQGKFREKTVFYVMNTDPLCNSVFHVVLWDCNGDIVKEYKPGQFDTYSKEVKSIENIYTCNNN